jgi:hypothetical protein
VNGECEKCRNSPCGQCPNHDALEVCKQCDHFKARELWPDMEGKTFYDESSTE